MGTRADAEFNSLVVLDFVDWFGIDPVLTAGCCALVPLIEPQLTAYVVAAAIGAHPFFHPEIFGSGQCRIESCRSGGCG